MNAFDVNISVQLVPQEEKTDAKIETLHFAIPDKNLDEFKLSVVALAMKYGVCEPNEWVQS